jgi:hypothetical protein
MPRQATIACSHRMTLVPSVLSITMGNDRSRYFAVKPAPACAPSGDDQRRPPPPHADQGGPARATPASYRPPVGWDLRIEMRVSGPSPRSSSRPWRRHAGTGYRVPARRPRGHIILWWWSSQLRWPVALLALLPPRRVGRRLLRPVLHPRADGLEQAVDDGGGDRAHPSDEGGGDDGILQPDGHLDDSWTGDNKSRARVARPMPHPESDRGLLREALRPLPQADAVSWVAAPSVYQSGSTGLPSSCSPGMAPGTAWPPASAGLLSMPPSHRRCPRTPRQTTPGT